ncbi:hypothetical protein DFA_04311 [Cavenderia fasciculata]|uniref:N-acetyltransferase domain-containing protein n=1 Tax=Cavenderia fasciculata TaxID=261658 RepID=F4PP80_CACFS|nr:uncharacterized protein DFA_04311 [Cavenderia fasciculata]EGG22193.1 hypothetical protein DFA_04311 [Cavenderia fasciculata]|eukprot:XP_004360044.1 hypothetical protein DFA_04311 [Cavenderia fasciculata]
MFIHYEDQAFNDLSEDWKLAILDLFNHSYGRWSRDVKPPRVPGSRVRMTLRQLNQRSKNSFVILAKTASLSPNNNYNNNNSINNNNNNNNNNNIKNELVGYALYTKFMVPQMGEARWIVQFVVSGEYRHHHIGRELISHALGTGWTVSGLVSSNPYAIRCLEKASSSQCSSVETCKYVDTVIQCCNISYIRRSPLHCTQSQSLIDTRFRLDHTDSLKYLEDEKEKGHWKLGDHLPEGMEFVGLVFNHQLLNNNNNNNKQFDNDDDDDDDDDEGI